MFFFSCFFLVSLVCRSIFWQQGVLLFSFLFCFLLWLVFVCFSFIFVGFFSYFLPFGPGRRFLVEGRSQEFFSRFFFSFFFVFGALCKGFFCFFFRVFWSSVKYGFLFFFFVFFQGGALGSIFLVFFFFFLGGR